mmetsp:Transcript_77795/g.171805  ORF Transcript_77795/g.171805 Transcript_77795/m.171805 type:complete len:232 (-) Transcript_77795:171-866(-)
MVSPTSGSTKTRKGPILSVSALRIAASSAMVKSKSSRAIQWRTSLCSCSQAVISRARRSAHRSRSVACLSGSSFVPTKRSSRGRKTGVTPLTRMPSALSAVCASSSSDELLRHSDDTTRLAPVRCIKYLRARSASGNSARLPKSRGKVPPFTVIIGTLSNFRRTPSMSRKIAKDKSSLAGGSAKISLEGVTFFSGSGAGIPAYKSPESVSGLFLDSSRGFKGHVPAPLKRD